MAIRRERDAAGCPNGGRDDGWRRWRSDRGTWEAREPAGGDRRQLGAEAISSQQQQNAPGSYLNEQLKMLYH